jgi:probable rRNA maturation factor
VPVEVRCAGSRARAYASAVRKDARNALQEIGLADAELSLMLVDDRTMRSLNRRYRRKDRTTDVLSFPQLEAGRRTPARPVAERASLLGDVVISVPTAMRQARELGVTPAARMRTLLIHGLLHLLGYDHERSAGEAKRMFARTQALERQLGALDAGGAGAAPGRARPSPSRPRQS